MAQYTYTGYDASAHVAEETMTPVEAPKGIVTLGLGVDPRRLLPAHRDHLRDPGLRRARTTETGLPPAQIFIDAAGAGLGTSLLFICAVAQFFCGMASVTANSRMSYAFSRDNALPGSRLWRKVNPRTGTPTNSIWLCVVCSIVLALPALLNTAAYAAVTSIAVIGLYISYVVPVFLRRSNPDFPWAVEPRPVERAVGWTAIVWVGLIVVLFMLPAYAPGTLGDATFNYAPLAVLFVLAFSTVSWFLGGRKHFMVDVPEGHDTKTARRDLPSEHHIRLE